MSRVPAPRWLITYESQDVSDELARMTTSIEYTDNLQGKSDELTINLEDREGRWREGWFPSAGDRLVVRLGIEGAPLLDAGQFTVDEVELDGPPDVVSIRALATPMSGQLRTAQSRGFEATTLREIAVMLATELDLELVGDVADIAILRATQASETTVAFLRRLAASYGYAFSIRPPKLIFFELAALEAAPASFTLRRQDLQEYRFKSGVHGTYAACEVRWFDPQTKELRKALVTAAHARERIIVAPGADNPPSIPSRLLQQGVRGEDVRAWQQFLVARNLDTGGVDGIFGPKTRASTIAFQREQGLKPDGIAGPETFRVAVEQGYGSTTAASDSRVEVSGAILRREIRVETSQQAEARARALLAEANRLRATGTVKLGLGDVRAVAGAKFDLTGMGRLSGSYSIQSSKHRMDRSGAYVSDLEVTYV